MCWLLGVVLLIVASACAVDVANRRTQEKATFLLRDVEGLRLAVTTEDEVQQIIARYGGDSGDRVSGLCQSPDTTTHSITITNPFLNWLGTKNSILRPFGNREWSVTTDFLIDHGKLCALLYNVRAVQSGNRFVINATLYFQQGVLSSDDSRAPYRTSVRQIKQFNDLGVWLTTDATAEQRRMAFDFNLSCLDKLGGCRDATELVPAAQRTRMPTPP